MLELYVHRRHTLVEDLSPHQLNAGHDLLLVAHQRHPEPLDVPAGHTQVDFMILDGHNQRLLNPHLKGYSGVN